ncbi:phage holin family protein [Thioclava sp.]|uniref:phage holin family protein n=1 Tax=Thioclava sp. TaxID=1933450 RepID=UPI003AA8CDF5
MPDDEADDHKTKTSERSVSELFSHFVDQAREIARAEADLARAEAMHRVSLVRNAVIFAGIALIFGIGAIGPLVQSGVYALEWLGLDKGPATLIAGAVLVLVAIILALIAITQMRRAGRPPKRIKENLSADAQTIKETFK